MIGGTPTLFFRADPEINGGRFDPGEKMAENTMGKTIFLIGWTCEFSGVLQGDPPSRSLYIMEIFHPFLKPKTYPNPVGYMDANPTHN